MTWEDKLREKLQQLKGSGTIQDLAEQTGISASHLYKVMSGHRGIGADALEQLRQTFPTEVAGVFAPDDYCAQEVVE